MPRRKDASLPSIHAATPAWVAVVRAYHLCDQLLAKRLAALGLRTAELDLLVSLLLYPGSSQQQVGAHLISAKSVVSTLVSKAEARGWLQREADAQDARVWRLSLSREGEQLAREALAIQNEVVALMTAPHSAAELAQVKDSMDRASALLSEALKASA